MEQPNRNSEPIMVSISCITYNQSRYIRDCLEGFVMQKTNFRFEAIVHDDASTDGNAEIIKKYADKYPNIIKPIFETENQWSKHDGSLGRIMFPYIRGKYIAWCEGDDYWIDPLKLQKQVDFLENHLEYSMCWTDAFQEMNGERVAFHRYADNCQSSMEDIIEKGGSFIPTCSIVARYDIWVAMPKEAKGWYVGDFPLQMWFGWAGKCWYIKEQTCIYRAMAIGSWSERQFKNVSDEKFQKMYENELPMMNAFNKLTEYKYNESFERYAANVLYKILLWAKNYSEAKQYLKLRKKYGIHTGHAEKLLVSGYPNLSKLVDVMSRIKHLITGSCS